MLRNYTSSFSDTELNFFKFHEHKNMCVVVGGGEEGEGRYPGQGIFIPTPSSWYVMQSVT